MVPFELVVNASDPEFEPRDLFPHEADDFTRRVVHYFHDIVGREDLNTVLVLGLQDMRCLTNNLTCDNIGTRAEVCLLGKVIIAEETSRL